MRKITQLNMKFFEMIKTAVFGTCLLFFCFMLFPANITAAETLELFVSIPPQKFLADRLGGERVTTRVLIGEGKSPHLFHPSTRQLVALSQARLFFAIDMEFERVLIEKLRHTGTLQIVNSVQDITKQVFPGHDGHDEHGALDPHVWLSPPNLIKMAATMAAAMAEADPGNSAYYAANLERLQKEFKALDTKIAAELASFAGASFYVFHPSFAYFARRYNLHQEAVEVEGKAPTPKQLSGLIKQARKENVKVIFVQKQFDPRSANSVAQAIGGKVLPLNPLAENVMENLQVMAETIRSGLSQ